MTLRKKTLLVLGVAMVCLILILYGSSRLIILDRYLKLEEQTTRLNVDRAVSALDSELSKLTDFNSDYANWDDTYAFIENGNEQYILSNFSDQAFIQNKLSLLIIIDQPGQIIYAKFFDLDPTKEQEVPLPNYIAKYLSKDGFLELHNNLGDSIGGILMLPNGPMLVAANPILTSDRKGPARGMMIMGRYLNEALINTLSDTIHMPLDVYRYSDLQKSAVLQHVKQDISKETPVLAHPASSKVVHGYALINDIFGAPGLILKTSTDRDIYQQGIGSIKYFLLSLLAFSFVFVVLTMMLLDKTLLARLDQLSNNVEGIGSNHTARVIEAGNDELSGLAKAINGMLEVLEQSREELQESKERYQGLAKQMRDIIEFLPDATFVIDQDKRVIFWNRAIEEMTGVPKVDIIGKGDYAYAVPFYGGPRHTLIDLVVTSDREKEQFYEYVEARGQTLFAETYAPALFNGQGAYLWATASPLYDGEGNLAGAVESIRDITERKRAEEQLKHFSLHDALTGLYNRAFFEQEMLRLNNKRYAPVGIILCDVDGLKLINDTLGHTTGDALLVVAARVIRESFRQGDMVARMGGDEFAVLLPNSDREAVESVINRIREAVAVYNRENPSLILSISIGCAVGDESFEMIDLYKEADMNMYRDKLQRSHNVRSAILLNIIKVLEDNDYTIGRQADRLQELVMGLGRFLCLDDQMINSLRLLAQFYDIGKVGVPEHILNKPGSLTVEEVTEVQLHSEIGHRIAQSAPELAHISDWILKHHEWWNGQGYPLGIEGKEIPLASRIMAIADAYDAMTNRRPYRNIMTHQEAVEELLRCAGTQFDANLVNKFICFLENNEKNYA